MGDSNEKKRDRRQERVAEREENYRTSEEQLAHLDATFGVNQGAQKERTKLAKKLTGFTLIELMITIAAGMRCLAILTLVGIGIYAFFI